MKEETELDCQKRVIIFLNEIFEWVKRGDFFSLAVSCSKVRSGSESFFFWSATMLPLLLHLLHQVQHQLLSSTVKCFIYYRAAIFRMNNYTTPVK